MIKILMWTLGLLCLILPGMTMAQTGLSLDHVDGLYGTSSDTLRVGVPVMFHLRLTNNPGNPIVGYTNGFRVSSSTGAQWGTTAADSTGAITSGMNEQQFINLRSITGSGADTVGFGGFSLFAPGIPDGFDQIVWEISIGPIDSQYHQGDICIDSSYYPPAGIWKWSTTQGDMIPSWDGPHCFTIFNPNAPVENNPPVLAPIGNQSVDEGQHLGFGTSALDSDGDPLTLSMESADLPPTATFTDNGDGSGDFSWTPSFEDSGPYLATFFASDGKDTVFETITISVTNVNRAPILDPVGDKQVLEHQSLSFRATGSDPDGDNVSLSMSSPVLALGATFVDSGNGAAGFVWSTGFDDSGVYPAVFYLTDGTATDSEAVTIAVIDVNRAPILDPIGNKNVLVGQTLSFGVTASDPDGDFLWLGITAPALPPQAVYIDSGNGVGQFNWTPTDADVGSYQVLFDVSDGDLSDNEPMTIGVTRPGGGLTAELAIEPDTIYSLFQFSIESATGTILFGNITSGQIVDDIIQSSLLINSTVVPVSVSILDSYPGFTGRVLEIVYPMPTFIQSYGLLWDYSDQLYTVSGSLIDQASFELSNFVPFRGHVSGDGNLDGVVDILDLTLLIDYIFLGGRPPRIPAVADVTGEGEVDISDLTGLIRIIFF